MRKANMLRWLSYEFDSWQGVCHEWTGEDANSKPINHFGWYAGFDGPSLGEAYLTNSNPASDKSGDVISVAEFNDYIN